MICYRDQTFCPYGTCVKFNKCPTAFTKEVEERAIKWWGSKEAPVCLYTEQPDCFVGVCDGTKE